MKNEYYIGKKINKWEIIDYKKDEHGGKWLCRCECGEKKWQKVYNIKNGKSKMCKKCSSQARKKEKKERIIKIRFDSNKEWTEDNTFIGTYKEYLEKCRKMREERKKAKKYIPISYDRLYKIHQKMKERCYNKNAKSYKNYGGRGITICKEWLDDYKNFKEWALKNGYNDNLTIDRINVNGNYEPNNCRWADAKTQQNNRRNNHYIEYNGQIKTLKQWSEIYNLCPDTIAKRIKRGVDKDELFSKRVKSNIKSNISRKKYEETKKYQKELKKARRTLATVLKRVQVKKLLKNLHTTT